MEREKERENKKKKKKIKIRKLGFRKLKKKWKVGDIGKKQKGNQHLSNY
jgi:hypothetical protein